MRVHEAIGRIFSKYAEKDFDEPADLHQIALKILEQIKVDEKSATYIEMCKRQVLANQIAAENKKKFDKKKKLRTNEYITEMRRFFSKKARSSMWLAERRRFIVQKLDTVWKSQEIGRLVEQLRANNLEEFAQLAETRLRVSQSFNKEEQRENIEIPMWDETKTIKTIDKNQFFWRIKKDAVQSYAHWKDLAISLVKYYRNAQTLRTVYATENFTVDPQSKEVVYSPNESNICLRKQLANYLEECRASYSEFYERPRLKFIDFALEKILFEVFHRISIVGGVIGIVLSSVLQVAGNSIGVPLLLLLSPIPVLLWHIVQMLGKNVLLKNFVPLVGVILPSLSVIFSLLAGTFLKLTGISMQRLSYISKYAKIGQDLCFFGFIKLFSRVPMRDDVFVSRISGPGISFKFFSVPNEYVYHLLRLKLMQSHLQHLKVFLEFQWSLPKQRLQQSVHLFNELIEETPLSASVNRTCEYSLFTEQQKNDQQKMMQELDGQSQYLRKLETESATESQNIKISRENYKELKGALLAYLQNFVTTFIFPLCYRGEETFWKSLNVTPGDWDKLFDHYLFTIFSKEVLSIPQDAPLSNAPFYLPQHFPLPTYYSFYRLFLSNDDLLSVPSVKRELTNL